MKSGYIYLIACVLTFVLSSCAKQGGEHEHHHDATAEDEVEVSANQQLYDEVMKIHDEVMPKMDDIRKLKSEIKKKIDEGKTLTNEERIKLDAMYAKLDSAGDGMMIWMREFRPIPDSLGEEKAREYLENEMERVKRVRENINTALKEAGEQK